MNNLNWFCAAAVAAWGWGTSAQEFSIEQAPAVVIRTSPVAGTIDVDPATTRIKVTFSKPMQDGSWSWTTWGEETFPEMDGKPYYEADGRTCVLPVKLQPGRFYATWLNSQKFGNFRDAQGRSAVPYLLTFQTAGEAQSDSRTQTSTTGGPAESGLASLLSVVPELIHLTYHGNTNTRWWAQISLVRLTGVNFGKDWQGWGRWWNQQGNQPAFDNTFIKWYSAEEWSEPDAAVSEPEEGTGNIRDLFAKHSPRRRR
jgi:hypothetical protein